jgi:hypothetical protein
VCCIEALDQVLAFVRIYVETNAAGADKSPAKSTAAKGGSQVEEVAAQATTEGCGGEVANVAG